LGDGSSWSVEGGGFFDRDLFLIAGGSWCLLGMARTCRDVAPHASLSGAAGGMALMICVLPDLPNVINTVIRVYLDPIGPDGILVKNKIDRYGEIMTMIQD